MKHLWLILFVLISNLNSQQTVAVLDFEALGVSVDESKALTNRFVSEFLDLSDGKYLMLERQQFNEIIKEQGLQQSGCISSECAVEVGAALGANLIIIGGIAKVGTIYSVNSKIIDVESSKILKSVTYDNRGDISELLIIGMKKTAEKLLNMKSTDPISFNKLAGSISSNTLESEKSISSSERIKESSPVKVKPKKTITITSPLSSEVYINDKFVGKTPLENFTLTTKETIFFQIKIKDGAYTRTYLANYLTKNHEIINHEPNYYKGEINKYYLEMNWPGFSIITPYIFNFDISFDSPDVKDTRGECTNWWSDEDSKAYGDSSVYSDENTVIDWSFPCRDFKAPPGKYSFKIYKSGYITKSGSITLSEGDKDYNKKLIYNLEKIK